MSEPVRVPPGLEHLVRTIVGGSADERDQRTSTFARGVALGALVGAAIAGSTIWQRRHGRTTLADGPETAAGNRPGTPSA